MAVRSAGWVLTASVLLLTGCAAASPVPPGLTDEQAEAIVAEQQGAAAFFYNGVVPPPLHVIEFTTPETWSTVQATCRQATSAAPPSGGDRDAECQAEYPIDPRLQGYLSEAQADYAYAYLTRRLAPCLETLGYRVPPAPDREDFVASLPHSSWQPYPDLPAASSQWARIDATCPPLPADPFVMYQPPVTG